MLFNGRRDTALRSTAPAGRRYIEPALIFPPMLGKMVAKESTVSLEG